MRTSFKRILCPIDLNADCSEALELALMVARQHQASVCLLYVSSLPLPAPSEAASGSEPDISVRLEQIGHEWLGGKVPYEVEVWTGDVATAILRAIQSSGIDLVVMATHGREGMDRLVLGSVTEQVVRDSPKPVLTIKPSRSGR